jgi:hypothetical protein
MTTEDRNIGRKTCPIFTLSITNLTGKPALGNERPTTARALVRPQTVDKEQKQSGNIALLELTIGRTAGSAFIYSNWFCRVLRQNYQAAGDFKVGQPCHDFVTALRH